MSYYPLHVHTQFSLLDGLPSAKKVAKRIADLGLEGCAISDHASLAGVVDFVEAMQAVNKRPIIGIELNIDEKISEEKKDNKYCHLVVLSKNFDGWRALVKIVSESNKKENFYRRPRISLEKVKELNSGKNLIAFSGHPGSKLANCLFHPDLLNLIYGKDYTYEIVKKALLDNWEEICEVEIRKLQDCFGEENFFIEIQLIDKDRLPCEIVIAECLRKMAVKLGIKKVATPDAHYPSKEDAIDQRILLCSALKTTLPEVEKKLETGDDVALGAFFKSNNYHIPSFEEMRKLHTNDELENTFHIANMCENYSIFSKPKLPVFTTPNGQSSVEYLKELCREGWKKLILPKIPKSKHKEYGDRVKAEFEVLEDAGLADYFLIVYDILRYVRSRGWLPGVGRGSAAGSLVAYLVGITAIDPIKHGLIFERFYNNGRNIPNHIPFPFSLAQFEELNLAQPISEIQYIKERYEQGKNRAGFLEELKTLEVRRTARYYDYLIKNIDLNRDNPENSYIMWMVGKTDKIDLNKPPKIKQGKTSMPDIDIDVPAHVREDVIQYIKDKYGEARVCQIITFQSMKGRRVLKDVFRVHGGVPADLMNVMTSPIPDEAKIADELQEMKEEEGFSSIVQWSLENKAKELEEYAKLNEDGSIGGMFGKRFEQAIRLEGTKTNQSKHAAGILISSVDLDEVCPMSFDSSTGTLIAGMEMNSLEKIGLIKFDILGVSVLTKLMTIQEILSE